MKLIVEADLTLDGVMQSPGMPEEDPSGGFEHGGWLVPFADDVFHETRRDWIRAADALLLGRKTYELFAGYWPRVTDPDNEIATMLNTMPKHVASRTLETLEWNNSRLIKGDVSETVGKLKSEPGRELQVHGSVDLVQTLMRDDLVDEYRLSFAPVVLGTGKRLFREGAVPPGCGWSTPREPRPASSRTPTSEPGSRNTGRSPSTSSEAPIRLGRTGPGGPQWKVPERRRGPIPWPTTTTTR